MDGLSDKDIIAATERARMAGCELDGQWYPKRPGESPMDFIERVRGEHNAWKASQEIEKARTARNVEVGNSRGSDRSDSANYISVPSVQAPKKSLVETIKSQVAEQREEYATLIVKREKVEEALTILNGQIKEVESEIELAEDFLSQLEKKNESTSETST